MKTANHWNGAIYTDEFAGINPNLTVFLFVQQFVVGSAIAMLVPSLYLKIGKENAYCADKAEALLFRSTFGRGFMKAIFRLISFLFLAAAVGFGSLDSVRSVATSSVDMMSAQDVWSKFFPASQAMAEGIVAHYIHPEAWRWFESGLSTVPAFAILLAVSLLFWMAGYRKPKVVGRFAA